MSTITFKLRNGEGKIMEHEADAKDFIEHYKSVDDVYDDIQPECDCYFTESNNHCECEPQYEDYSVVAFKLNDDEWQEIDPHVH
jgi:hypothetical protein